MIDLKPCPHCGVEIKEIQELKMRLNKAVEVIKFYGAKESWVRGKNDGRMAINSKDREMLFYKGCDGENIGGKKAREFLKEIGDAFGA